MYLIRDEVLPLLSARTFSLREARHAAAAVVHRAKDRKQEEIERLRFFERKVSEKMTIHDRALEEYEKARHVLSTARDDRAATVNLEEKTQKAIYRKNCEALVKSWGITLDSAREGLALWQFKNTRQIAFVGKLTDEAHGAELTYRRTSDMIDVDISNLQTVSDFLERATT